MIARSLSTEEMQFPQFLREAWEILEPNNPLVEEWYIDYLCEYLELVTKGEIRRLLINIPPRLLKSTIVTIMWPVWSWTIKPFLKFVFCSYSSGLSVKHSVDRRTIIESDWYQTRWGNIVRLRDDQNQKQEYENTARGRMMATSVGGTMTGKGGDIIVEDDMLNPQEADSSAARSHTISMHKNVLSSRLDNLAEGIRVIVEQRTHYKDLTNHVLTNEKGWHHLCLPMIADKKTQIIFPVSKNEIWRLPGGILASRRLGKKEIDNLKSDMGTRTWIAQAQQNPTSEEGNIIKRDWWKFWHKPPEGANYSVQSWDMTFKKTEEGSYVVGQVWKKRGAQYFLMDQFRARVDFAETIPSILSLSGKWPEALGKLIEEAANGPAIMSQLQTRLDGIIPIKPSGTKVARAQAVAPLIEAGNVVLPHPSLAPWVHDFIEECAAFKGVNGEINDQVDAMSQALSWLHDLDYQVQDFSPDVSWMEDSMDDAIGGFS